MTLAPSYIVLQVWWLSNLFLSVGEGLVVTVELVLYSHDKPYKHICMRNYNDDTIKTNDTVF